MLRRILWAPGLGALALSPLLVLGLAFPAHAVYPVVNPPGPPQAVVAVAGDSRVTVAWQPPATDGGAPVTGYRVTSSPASAGCSVGAGTLTCDIAGLTNGTSYVFSVAAGNSAGFGVAASSSPVTPQAAAPVITISIARNGGSVFVAGTTKNVPAGAVLSSWVRLEGQSSFTQGGPATARADNTFAWSAPVPTDKGAEVYFTYQGVQSNVASSPADAQTSLAIGGSRAGSAVSISGLSTNIPAGASVTLLTRVNAQGDFAAAGTAVVGADGRFSWSASQPEADQLAVVAEYNGLRSNILVFAGANKASIVISGSRSANGRQVTVTGRVTGIPAGATVQATVTLDGSPAPGAAVTVQSDGRFQWQRAVGAQRTVTVLFTNAGTASNLVTLVPGQPSIGITGTRDGRTITVAGLASNMDEGTSLTAYVRVEGDVGFIPETSARVQADGSFTWSRDLIPTKGAEVYFVGGGARSNTAFIPATASAIVITGTRTRTTIAISGLATNLQAGDTVTLRTRAFGDRAYKASGTTTVGADGAFSFTTSAPLDTGLSMYVEGKGSESNTLVFNPLAPSIVLYRASLTPDRFPTLSVDGQAFNVDVGTVLVPYVSLNGGPFTTGVGVRTLNDEGRFSWSRLIAPGRGKVSVYFATVDGVQSNTLTVRR